MKLGWPEMWPRVSRIKSRVSPRAGGTNNLAGGVGPSVSVCSAVNNGVLTEGVPGFGEGENPRDFDEFRIGVADFGGSDKLAGASLSIVKVKKSSCCSFKWVRIVSSIVDMVRKARWRTRLFSDRASWKRNLHPGSMTMAFREGNCATVGPDSSNAALRIPRAVKRVESVCC